MSRLMLILTSHHGEEIVATPGRTVLKYRDGFLQNDAATYPTEREAARHAADLNAIEAHSPMVHNNCYVVAR